MTITCDDGLELAIHAMPMRDEYRRLLTKGRIFVIDQVPEHQQRTGHIKQDMDGRQTVQGVPITDDLVLALAEKAEAGYDIEILLASCL